MPLFPSHLLASWTGGYWTVPPDSALGGFTMDTRQLRLGQVFVAIRTDKRDGHDFLPAALAAGASAALVAVPNPAVPLAQLVVADPLTAFQAIAREHRRRFTGPVIGITGSAGKTSTKNLLALLLGGEEAGVLATEGNLNNQLGVPLTLTRLEPGVHTLAVIEAGIGGRGEMAPLAAMIAPDVAIVTLVAAAHTAELGGLAGVAEEKAQLASAVGPKGIALFPESCAAFAAFAALRVRQNILERVSAERRPEMRHDRTQFSVAHGADTTTVTLSGDAAEAETYVLRRVSDGMAQNAALAIAAARWVGTSVAIIRARLGSWQPARLRGEVRRVGDRLYYLDCYNANPASMADALEAFYAMAPAGEPRLFILGGMEELGSDAEAFHRALGRSLRLRPQDWVCVIGDHAAAVRAGAAENGRDGEQVEVATSREVMSGRLAGWRGAVFVKGSRKYALEKVLETSPAETRA